MIKKIKCLFKGHQYLMNYNPGYNCYYQSKNDICKCCKSKRKQKEFNFNPNETINFTQTKGQ